jgi:hypothetical protein
MDNQKPRQIDILASSQYSWWSKNYILIKNAKIKTLHGAFILAFIAGALIMLIWTISDNYLPF